jgi:Flp pilus assembly secretin CpaC
MRCDRGSVRDFVCSSFTIFPESRSNIAAPPHLQRHRSRSLVSAFRRFLIALALPASVIFIASAAAETPIEIKLDQAQIIRLPERVATLVIGNPQVADGTLQKGGLLVVTGKSYGTTNIIALDASGEVLVEHNITVGAPRESSLTVWRGVSRETWSCAPRCEASVMLGDAQEYFDAAVKQVETRNGFAGGRAQSKGAD